MKEWILSAMETREASLAPASHEINEFDWKQSFSPKKKRLMQHLSVFANHLDGGVFVYGINNQTAMPNGIQQKEAEVIFGQIANLGRDALELPVAIDHAIVGFHNASLLFVHIKREKMISKSHYLRH